MDVRQHGAFCAAELWLNQFYLQLCRSYRTIVFFFTTPQLQKSIAFTEASGRFRAAVALKVMNICIEFHIRAE